MGERSDSKELREKAAATARELVEQTSPMNPLFVAICMGIGTEAYLRGREDGVEAAKLRDYHTS